MPEMRGLFDMRNQNGTKIIVIDPRLTESAAKADLWLPIRPGTDAAMALAWLNVIITEGLYNQTFIQNMLLRLGTTGRAYPAVYSGMGGGNHVGGRGKNSCRGTDVCHQYAGQHPVGVAVDQIGRPGGAAMHARALLRAVTGNLDAPGSDLLCGPNPTMITDEEMECNDRLSEEQKAKQLGSDMYKLVAWPGYTRISELTKRVWGKAPPAEWMCEAHGPSVFEAILTGKPYTPRALLVLADNTLSAYPNSRKTDEALKKLDLLTVMDYWLTPTAMLADYVLRLPAGWRGRR
jgi:anaerobic selenocysteine-containing dehydrogenase